MEDIHTIIVQQASNSTAKKKKKVVPKLLITVLVQSFNFHPLSRKVILVTKCIFEREEGKKSAFKSRNSCISLFCEEPALPCYTCRG